MNMYTGNSYVAYWTVFKLFYPSYFFFWKWMYVCFFTKCACVCTFRL